jgi:hypothetical protein
MTNASKKFPFVAYSSYPCAIERARASIIKCQGGGSNLPWKPSPGVVVAFLEIRGGARGRGRASSTAGCAQSQGSHAQWRWEPGSRVDFGAGTGGAAAVCWSAAAARRSMGRGELWGLGSSPTHYPVRAQAHSMLFRPGPSQRQPC